MNALSDGNTANGLIMGAVPTGLGIHRAAKPSRQLRNEHELQKLRDECAKQRERRDAGEIETRRLQEMIKSKQRPKQLAEKQPAFKTGRRIQAFAREGGSSRGELRQATREAQIRSLRR